MENYPLEEDMRTQVARGQKEDHEVTKELEAVRQDRVHTAKRVAGAVFQG